MPVVFLLASLASLLAIAVPAGALWILWQWWAGELVSSAWLICAIVMLAWSVAGRYLVLAFYPQGDQEPEVRNGGRAGLTVEGPDGSRIHVDREGPPDKPVLVLTHGWLLDSQAWFYARQYLAKRHRLILWDLPGLGQSTQPADHRYSVERLAEDLRAVIEQQAPGTQQVTLVGHSIGGMLMLTLCRLHPDFIQRRVNGLVFIDTTYTYPLNTAAAGTLLKALRWPVIEPLLHMTVMLWPLAWLMNWLAYFNGTSHLVNRSVLLSGNVTRGQLDTVAWYSAKDHPGVVAKGLLAVLRWNEENTLSGINVPARVITGSLDRLTKPIASHEMARRIPKSDLVTIDPAGHVGLLEKKGGDYGRAIGEAAQRFAQTAT
jgi:pimeloyl-ACP methyl ester carboxylesterase